MSLFQTYLEAVNKGGKFKVEMNFSYGWDDADWHEDDQPQRFNSRKEAQEAIDEFIDDQHDAHKRGDMQDKYSKKDFRIVPA